MLVLRIAVMTLTILTPLASSWAEEAREDRKPSAGGSEQSAVTDRPAVKRPGFTISKETTYITEPLTPDGYPDYFAAWERECSRGVTPENNAVVTLLRAFGPGIVPESQRGEFFAKLGATSPPEHGKYFISEEEFIARRRQAKGKTVDGSPGSEKSDISPKPSEDYAAATKAWLADIDQALDVAVEASKRPRWYEPLLTGEEPSMLLCAGSALIRPGPLPQHRPGELVAALLHRVAARSEGGKFSDALPDLLAVHRFAELISQDPSDFSLRSGYITHAVACEYDAAIACSGQVPQAQAEQYLKELQRLGPSSISVRQLEYRRHILLDAMTRIQRNGNLVLTSFAGAQATQDPAWKEKLAHASESDRPLRIANALINLLISAAREPTFQRQLPKVQLAGFAMMGLGTESSYYSEERPPKGTDWSPRACEQPAMTILMVGLQAQVLDECIAEPSLIFYPIFVQQSRAAACFELATTTWALALYRGAHGQYPENLADCCPRYLPQVPRDPFRDAPLVYRRKGERFVLYSVGPNGRDDQGENSGGQLDMSRTDDISLISLPLSK